MKTRHLKYLLQLRWLVITVLAIFMLLPNIQLNATHIVGGNMYYKCLGNDMYEITMKIRRDCLYGADDAPHDGPQVLLTIFDGLGQFFARRGDNGFVKLDLLSIDTLDADLDDFCNVNQDSVCVSEATYRGMVCLPKEETGYIISYQRCCRNETLNNIEMPLETGGTWMVEITPEAQDVCNSNPVFNTWPPIYICANDDLVYDHSATDPDGDSLVYKLCTPLKGATIDEPAPGKSSSPPFDSVDWKSPYNRTDMMGGVPLRIDPQTGIITATPDMIGQFVIGIVVEEYRNGELIGRNKRDFEFNVRACGEKPEAGFNVLTGKCDGLKQIFENTSVGATDYIWYFDYPNLQPSSMEESPMHTYDSSGTYTVVLIAESELGCRDTASKVIEVLNPMLVAAFETEVECNDSLKLRLINRSSGKDSLVLFDWEVVDANGDIQVSNDVDPVFCFTEDGKVIIRLTITDINGCTASTEDTVDLENVDIEFIQDSFSICNGEEIRILKGGDPDWTYTWEPMDGLKFDPPHDPLVCPDSSTTYCVTVTNGICSDSGCIYIEVTDSLEVDISGPDSTCTGMVTLMAMPDTVLPIEWSLDLSFTDIIATGPKLDTTINSTTIFYARVGGDTLCPGIDSHRVVYFDPVNENIPTSHVICFGSGMVQLNPNGDTTLDYNWSPGDVLDDSTSANPKATLDRTTKFTVVITNPKYTECPDTQMVLVLVGKEFDIYGLPEDTVICEKDSICLTVQDIPSCKIEWCDQDGQIIGIGHSIKVLPDSLLEFIVVKIEDTLGCVKTDTMRIDFYDIDISLQAPDTICAGDTAMIMLIYNGTDSLVIEWQPEDEIIGPNNGPVIKVAPDTTTTYSVKVTNEVGCMEEAMITIDVGGFNFEVDATADPPKINPGESVQLDVNVSVGVTYMWTGEGLDDPNIKSPIATLDTPGTYIYHIKVTDEFGCMATDTVSVMVREPDCIDGVFLPNAFSPNNDGFNDLLYVRSVFVQDMELMIFNRWGEKVFESNDQSIPWDGTFNNKKLPPDVYGYILKYKCIDGEDYVKEGNISLIL
ncbi:MAG: gliding motility-associated C-terminal domain-containing protein [Saprospiraceae bacterium]|nr:gliding motility-associated C-terminal domain-containing protein [Saprospiraceae bacterium]